MESSANILVTLLNMFSLILGGLAIGVVLNLTRKSNDLFLLYYFLFLICGVVAGFFDWVLFNWVIFLIPEMTIQEADRVYHIFWDSIGFTASLFTLYFLIRALSELVNLQIAKNWNRLLLFLFCALTLTSFLSLYFRLVSYQSLISYFIWGVYLYLLPFAQLLFIAFILNKIVKHNANDSYKKYFTLLIFFIFALWYFFSLIPQTIGYGQHIIILIYFSALFIPTVYLKVNFSRIRPISISFPENVEKLKTSLAALPLTEREKEVVSLLLEGRSNKEISDKLYISLQTVKNYLSKIYKRLGIKNRVELVNRILNSK